MDLRQDGFLVEPPAKDNLGSMKFTLPRNTPSPIWGSDDVPLEMLLRS